ncbi:lipid II flippase MurJ [Actinoplanes sp. NEAU-A12]|uniref:Lipid II flippase MurJ n=1 Tax=Actinoplanes sandaracinus TaxID=3045177 RepID=A0ABT6WNG9_9ACTN|nr:lipid II flippase MurJ [Actinoplanes sandaracinus]MDI6101297.1 lipid II flippase MurJ [Actinoplanes sandaracinus]
MNDDAVDRRAVAERPDETVSLLRAGRGMAIGALVSRITGFGRLVVMAAALGLGTELLDSYNVANTIPSVTYQLVFGGLATSLIIPAVSRELARDRAAGFAYAQRLLSATAYVLAAVVALTVVLAPLLVELYSPGLTEEQKRLTVVLSRFFLPQILLYGIGATAAAVLNSLSGHSAPMWAPAVNNVIVMAIGLGYIGAGGSTELGELSGRHELFLGAGTTAGVIGQAGMILWVLRRQGFPLRLRRDLRGIGIGRTARLGGWVLLTVIANQAAFTMAIRSASHLGPGAVSTYQTAYAIFHVPYAVAAVSVIVAALPRMSRAAAVHDTEELSAHLAHSLRAILWVTAPAGVTLLVLGPALSAILFAHGNSAADAVALVGSTVRVFGLAVVPFAAYAALTAAFNAAQDTRTAAVINMLVAAAAVTGFVGSARYLTAEHALAGIAASYAVAYTLGCLTAAAVLCRRLPGIRLSFFRGGRPRTALAVLLVAAIEALVWHAVVRLTGPGFAGSVAACSCATISAGVVYLRITAEGRTRPVIDPRAGDLGRSR